MRFGVLGPLAVWTDRGAPVAIPGRKVRALLADLLVHGSRAVSVDRLVEDLWGDASPADPVAALHVRVSQLRRTLAGAEPGGRDLVVSQAPGYALRAAAGAVDAARFAALVEQAHESGDPRVRAAALTDALAIWRGEALADFADDEFARAAVARWEEQRLAAVEARAEARLELGEHGELVGELGELVGRHPYRERLRAAHLRALHRTGRTGEALDGFQELRRRLAEELGLDPGPELVALHRAILAGDPAERAPAPPRRPVRPATNLPAPVTELIGREQELTRIREQLDSGRLVTLTGPGGVGKTSVALAVAHAVTDTYADGARLVDLTRWDGSGDAAEQVLAVLAIPDGPGGTAREHVASALREQRLLLVLDNCEHVVEPVAGLVAELLAAAPGLRVLATSREPLRLRGETRFELPPLDIPDSDDPDRLAGSPAVRLFLARAGLAPEPATAAGVAEICRRLDGLPLALELAAARVSALGVPELAARLQVPHDRFGLLGTGPRDAPDRQRTLSAVIGWSWQLLTGPERLVLQRLAVHSGGCTLAAAEAMCGDAIAASEVLDLVAGLVDRSLVVSLVVRTGEAASGPRFRMLESVSAYCLDRLREAGAEQAVRRRHAEYYLELAERAAPQLRGPGLGAWLGRLDAESANLRAALDTFCREAAAQPALRLATALVWYWYLRGRLTEARRALGEALAVDGAAPVALRAAAQVWHAGLALRQGEADLDRALPALEQIADPVDRAMAEWFLAAAVINSGDTAVTAKLLDHALETSRLARDRWVEAAVLSTRAMLAHIHGDLGALERDARRSADLFGELGDDWGTLQASDWLIGLADITGDHAEARRLGHDGLRVAQELGLWTDVAGRLAWLAWTALQVGEHPAARRYAEDARRLAAERAEQAGQVFATITLAFVARRQGDLEVAEEQLHWLLAAARRQQAGEGSPPHLPMVLAELGLLATQRGEHDAALRLLRDGFDASREQDSLRGMASALAGLAGAAAGEGRPDLGATLLGTAAAAWRRTGQEVPAFERDELARITTAVRGSEPDFDALFARGGALTPDQARALVDEGGA